jgi:putative membrane protein
MYVGALAELNLGILIPMLPGLILGAVGISFLMSLLFKRFYTATYSVIFGIFLSMIPNMLTENCVLGFNFESVLSVLLVVAGFLLSFWLGDLERNNAAIRSWLEKRKIR